MVAYHTHTLPTATKEEAAAGLRDDIALSPASLNGVTIPIVPLPPDWDDIQDKPATFPPELPIPSSGVTGLDAKQAEQDEEIGGKEPLLPPGGPDQFWRGDRTWAEGPVGPPGPQGNPGADSTVPGPQGPKGDLGGQIMHIGDDPPADPVVGQTWWEADSGNSFVYYFDGNSYQWVPSHVGAIPDLSVVTDVLVNAAQTLPRFSASADFIAVTSGTILLTYFRPRTSFTATRVSIQTGSSGASGLTLARIGIYSVASNGDLTLVASTPNDTALPGGSYSTFTKNFSTSIALVAGSSYAVGILQVGTTPCKFQGSWAQVQFMGSRPRLSARRGSLADLPASMTDASLSDSENAVYALLRMP